MRKIIFVLSLFVGFLGNAQQLLEVLKPNTNISDKKCANVISQLNFTPSDKCLELVCDRNYGDGEHDFIYCAVEGPNKRIWLNHNLGAEYTNIHSSAFNPQAIPINENDYKAFGSSFQMGRKADGHELVIYSTIGERVYVNRKYPTTTTKQDVFNSNNSYVDLLPEYPRSGSLPTPRWHHNGDTKDLWENQNLNNPCPIGYRLPNYNEMQSLVQFSSDIEGDLRGIIKIKKLTILLPPFTDERKNKIAVSPNANEIILNRTLWVGQLGNPSSHNNPLLYDSHLFEWFPTGSYVNPYWDTLTKDRLGILSNTGIGSNYFTGWQPEPLDGADPWRFIYRMSSYSTTIFGNGVRCIKE